MALAQVRIPRLTNERGHDPVPQDWRQLAQLIAESAERPASHQSKPGRRLQSNRNLSQMAILFRQLGLTVILPHIHIQHCKTDGESSHARPHH